MIFGRRCPIDRPVVWSKTERICWWSPMGGAPRARTVLSLTVRSSLPVPMDSESAVRVASHLLLADHVRQAGPRGWDYLWDRARRWGSSGGSTCQPNHGGTVRSCGPRNGSHHQSLLPIGRGITTMPEGNDE